MSILITTKISEYYRNQSYYPKAMFRSASKSLRCGILLEEVTLKDGRELAKSQAIHEIVKLVQCIDTHLDCIF